MPGAKPPGKRVIFIAHCFLNQFIRASGVRNLYKNRETALVIPLLKWAIRENIALEQLPCPEIFCEEVNRKASGKERYENPFYISVCKNLARFIVDRIEKYLKARIKVIGIIGIEGSPSCDKDGIFMKEIRKELKRRKIYIPFLSIRPRSLRERIKITSFNFSIFKNSDIGDRV